MRTSSKHEKETVWRLTEDDFRIQIEERYPDLTEEQTEKLVQLAHRNFSIDDWSEYVNIFIDFNVDDVK